MREPRIPSTAAVRVLKEQGVPYTEHSYRYEERGGTRVPARALGVEEHAVVKTLVMEDEAGRPMIVLMHGDRQVSTRELARQAARKTIVPCRPEAAERHTGYRVGGTSPLGTRKVLPVFAERSILALPRVYLNGGRRGLLVGIIPADLFRVLQPTLVEVALVP